MDYAKMAYLMVEDLSRRMDSLEQKAVYPYGVSLVASTSGRATVIAKRQTAASIIVRVRLYVSDATDVGIALRVGGVAAYEATYSLGRGEQDVFFLASATLDRGTNTVSCEVDGATVRFCELMTFGEGVSMQEGARMSACANMIVVCDGTTATLYDTATLTARMTVSCRSASLYEGASGDVLVFCDGDGAWRVTFQDDVPIRIELVDPYAIDACGCYDGSGEPLVTVRGGRAYADGEQIASLRDVVGVVGVYGASPPAFVFFDANGKMTYRTALRDVAAGRAA